MPFWALLGLFLAYLGGSGPEFWPFRAYLALIDLFWGYWAWTLAILALFWLILGILSLGVDLQNVPRGDKMCHFGLFRRS